MTDWATKILLGLIASGLFVNAAITLMRPAIAQEQDYSGYLRNIEHDVHDLYNGNCLSHKICD